MLHLASVPCLAMLIDVSPRRATTKLPFLSLNRVDVELFCLLTVLALSAACLVAAARAQLRRGDGVMTQLSRGEIVLLSPKATPESLLPAMRVAFPADAEAAAVAVRAAEFLSRQQRITHVGILARSSAGPLLNAGQLQKVKPMLLVRTADEFRSVVHHLAWWFFTPFILVCLIRRWRGQTGDPLLLPAVAALCGIGIATLLSIQDPLRDTLRALGMARICAAGCLLFLMASSIHYERHTRRLTMPAFALAVLLGIALALFGTGPAGTGVKVNLRIFHLTGQPSEIIKLLIVFFLAGYLAARWQYLRLLTQRRSPIFGISSPRWKDLLPLLIGVSLCLLLFLAQRDNGPALIIAATFLMLYGIARRHLLLVTGSLAACAMAAYGIAVRFPHAMATVLTRLEIWRNPWDNVARGGDQIAQSLWAFASGGVSGQGLGNSFSSVVPEVYTDMIGAAVAENLGFLGFSTIIVLYALLVGRGFRAGLRASGSYECFLAIGLAVAFAIQVLLILGGSLGLVPLTGVVSPFLSFGGVSALISFVVVGIWSSISSRSVPHPETVPEVAPLAVPACAVGALLALGGAAVLAAAGRYQVAAADATSLHSVRTAARWSQTGAADMLTEENPRFAILARSLRRGDILDAHGLPLATNNCELLDRWHPIYQKMDLTLPSCRPGERQYPLGDALAYTLGDMRHGALLQWDRQIERRYNDYLRGYRDNADLLPLLRHRTDPRHPAVRALLDHDRTLRLTIDGPLQLEVTRLFGEELARRRFTKGAVAILDPHTGAVLASVSYPLPSGNADEEIDRARVGLLPPGSAGKLLTDLALMRKDPALANHTFVCRRLPDGRAGVILSSGHVVRCDIKDHPHGAITMREAIPASCNGWHAAAGAELLGPQAFLDTAALFGIRACRPPFTRLRALMPETSYGQGELVVTPFQVARLAGAVANDGALQPLRWNSLDSEGAPAVQVVPAEAAERLGSYMRMVVTVGTAHRLSALDLAGKTGTSQRGGSLPPHSWFTGFAPYRAPVSERIAFAVVVEGGGYGAATAAPIAGRIVKIAADLGVISWR